MFSPRRRAAPPRGRGGARGECRDRDGGESLPVEDPAGPGGTNAGGISNRGVIVGFYFDSSGSIHGFELSPPR